MALDRKMSLLQKLKSVFDPDPGIIREVRNKLAQRPQLNSKEFAATYFPPEKRAIAELLMEITKEHSVADITGLIPDDAFVADLRMDDLDSLAIVDFIVHIETDFDITIPQHKAKSMRSFSELVDEIARLQKDNV